MDEQQFIIKLKRLTGIILLLVLLIVNPVTLNVLSGDALKEISLYVTRYLWMIDLWILLAFISLFIRGMVRKGHMVVFILFSLFVAVELTSAIAYRISYGRWHITERPYNSIFERHPYIVGTPRPNAIMSDRKNPDKTIQINRYGQRGQDYPLEKPKGVKRLVAIGGSTTFCTGVDNAQTWPYLLEKALKDDHFQVINMGAPGYATSEHVIQTAFHLYDVQPDYVLYYVGWNDLRNAHIRNLKSDYSGFHGRSQYSNLRLPPILTNRNLASLVFLTKFLQKRAILSTSLSDTRYKSGELSHEPDIRAMDIYESNLNSLIVLSRNKGAQPVMIPQILNKDALTGEGVYGWVPYVRDKDVMGFNKRYNAALKSVALEHNVPFLHEVQDVDWKADDFVDQGHFSFKGNRRFAVAVSQGLKRIMAK
ncbi:MAG: hypothetical protein HQL54_05105 [Magnetococcales bacterium]|nr:hypothetical protein [Magnetococcales bacterium]